MHYPITLAVTAPTMAAISQALNTVDDRLVRDGAQRRGESRFRLAQRSRRNDDGTVTSFFTTNLGLAVMNLNALGVTAEVVR